MPVTYCNDCNKIIDLDLDVEHFEMHEVNDSENDDLEMAEFDDAMQENESAYISSFGE